MQYLADAFGTAIHTLVPPRCTHLQTVLLKCNLSITSKHCVKYCRAYNRHPEFINQLTKYHVSLRMRLALLRGEGSYLISYKRLRNASAKFYLKRWIQTVPAIETYLDSQGCEKQATSFTVVIQTCSNSRPVSRFPPQREIISCRYTYISAPLF